MSGLMLKSTALKIFDYREIDIHGFVPPFEADMEKLEKDMNRLIAAHGRKVEAESIQAGDMAFLSCQSPNRKFQKENIPVVVGKGLFSGGLEGRIVGMRAGTEAEFLVGGDAVSVKVLHITRTLLPPLDDATVSSWDMEGVKTAADLRKYCIGRQIDRFLDENEAADMASAMVAQKVGENSVFVLDPGEEAYVAASVRNRLEASGDAGNGAVFDMMYPIVLNGLKMAVIGQTIVVKNGSLLTEEDYENVIRNHMEYDAKLSVEEAKQNYPVTEFLINRYADVYAKQIDSYVAESFKKIWNP